MSRFVFSLGLVPVQAWIAEALGGSAPAGERKTEVRVGQRVRAEVLGEEEGGYRLRLLDLDQEVVCRINRALETGERVKVRVRSLEGDGRVKEVIP